jgi:hypothetical protein
MNHLSLQSLIVDGHHEKTDKADKAQKEFERKRKLKLFINMGILIVSATANIVV